MSDLLKYLCIGVPLYLGTSAALLAILGANRDRHKDEIPRALDNEDAPNVAEENSTHAAHIVIHPVDSQCDGPDTVNSKESCLNGANSATIPTDDPLVRAAFPLQASQKLFKVF